MGTHKHASKLLKTRALNMLVFSTEVNVGLVMPMANMESDQTVSVT